MGGSKKYVAGYRYFFGIHMGIGRGPVDALLEIRVGDRRAWIGEVTANATININAPNLFGGDDKEGGIQGPFDVMMGEPDQVAGSRIRAMLGAVLPGYRGMFTAFYNGLISSNNPYPKPWKFRLRRILKGWDGNVFLPWAAAITWLPVESAPEVTIPLYEFTLRENTAQTPSYGTGFLSYAEYMETVPGWQPDFNDGLYIQAINADDTRSITITHDEATRQQLIASKRIRGEFTIHDISQIPSSLETPIAEWRYNMEFSEVLRSVGLYDVFVIFGWISTGVSSGYFGFRLVGISYGSSMDPFEIFLPNAGPSYAGSYSFAMEINFNDRIVSFWWNGSLVLEHPMDLNQLFLRNIDFSTNAEVTNSPTYRMRDVRLGIPYQQGRMGMNGAHIIYEALTNRDWGRGLARERIDETSFANAALVLFSEEFALCIKWVRQDSIESFVQSILDHIGGVLYRHRRTGLMTLKLIRDDYPKNPLDTGAPPSFDNETGLVEMREATVGSPGRGVNTVTVVWHDQIEDQDRTVTVRNNAAIRMNNGAIDATQKEYLGLPTAALALRIAQRDLRAASTNLRRFVFVLRWDRFAPSPSDPGLDITIHPGDVLRIRDNVRGIPWTFVRVGRVEYGSSTDSTIVVEAVQDVFSLPARAFSADVPSAAEPPNTTPCIDQQRVIEAPYFLLAGRMTPADLDYVPADGGFLGVLNSKGKPTNAGIQVAVRRSASTPDDLPPDDSYLCE